MTRAKPTPERAWATARSLAELVHRLEAERQVADQAAKLTIQANRLASDELSGALVPYRTLMQALSGNAGVDSKTSLADAVEAAEAVLAKFADAWPSPIHPEHEADT